MVVCDTEDGSGHFCPSQEGVTQWDPLDIITYGIGFLPLVRDFWDVHHRVTKPL